MNNTQAFQVGQEVLCNGFRGVVKKVCDGQLQGMLEVQVPGGLTCVGAGSVELTIGERHQAQLDVAVNTYWEHDPQGTDDGIYNEYLEAREDIIGAFADELLVSAGLLVASGRRQNTLKRIVVAALKQAQEEELQSPLPLAEALFRERAKING